MPRPGDAGPEVESPGRRRPDDTVATVIEDGKQSIYWDYAEHNATKRKWRVKVGRVREASHRP